LDKAVSDGFFKNVYKGKRVLVLGHTGFKGSWMTAWLNKLGAQVAGYSHEIPTTPSHYELAELSSDIIDYRGNIKDRERLNKCFQEFRPEVVFHMAANAIVSDCIENPIDAFETNLIGTVNVLEAIKNTDSIRSAVIVTSDKCYENVEWIYGYREDDKLGGKDPYSASKACAEIAFSSYYRTYFKDHKRLKIATARAGNVIGGGDWAKDRIVPDSIRAWSQNEDVKIRSPHSTRPWQLVLEPLSGYLHLGGVLLEEPGISGESFNFGPPAEVNKSVQLLLEEMQKYWIGKRIDIQTDHKIKMKEASLLKLCCDKALFHLNWNPTLNFEETVEFTSEWYLNWANKHRETRSYTNDQIEKYESLAKERGIVWAR